jgi:acyl-CoA thioester hydrolase
MSMQLPFTFPVRVYWEDTDAGGVVYHAGYIRFLERARSEWLRALGIGQQMLRDSRDLVFAVRGLRIDFRQPGRLDDRLLATIERIELRAASMVFAQRILREEDDVVLAEAEVRCACLYGSSFKPRPLPADLAARLNPSTAATSTPE